MNETSKTDTKSAIVLAEFHGSFAPFVRSAYYTLKAAGIAPKTAHKIARDFGSDIGNAIANAKDGDLAAKVAKAGKDGTSSIKLSGSGKTGTSPAMKVIRVCQVIETLYAEGLLTESTVNVDSLTDSLRATINVATVWASEQTWSN